MPHIHSFDKLLVEWYSFCINFVTNLNAKVVHSPGALPTLEAQCRTNISTSSNEAGQFCWGALPDSKPPLQAKKRQKDTGKTKRNRENKKGDPQDLNRMGLQRQYQYQLHQPDPQRSVTNECCDGDDFASTITCSPPQIVVRLLSGVLVLCARRETASSPVSGL